MVSTVWSVFACCSSTHGTLRAQPFVKVGGDSASVPHGVGATGGGVLAIVGSAPPLLRSRLVEYTCRAAGRSDVVMLSRRYCVRQRRQFVISSVTNVSPRYFLDMAGRLRRRLCVVMRAVEKSVKCGPKLYSIAVRRHQCIIFFS